MSRSLVPWFTCWLLLVTIHPADAGRPAGFEPRASDPRMHSSLPHHLRPRLQEAYRLAQRWVTMIPSCGELFEPLELDGLASLETTFYVGTTLREEDAICSRQVAAFTTLGGPATRLCRSFSRLPTPRASALLIHEALHTAGLPEAPLSLEALSSAQIDRLVSRHCDPSASGAEIDQDSTTPAREATSAPCSAVSTTPRHSPKPIRTRFSASQ